MNLEYIKNLNIDCEFTLTRYLYVTKYVKLSLIIALLEKDLDKALFWTFELYFSGLDQELFGLLWVVYFGFYASLNPELFDYLLETYKNWVKSEDFDEKSKIVCLMINNLIIRNYSIDVFILSKLSNSQNIDITGVELAKELEDKNFPVITKYIMSKTKLDDLLQTYKEILDYFKKKNKNKEMDAFRKMMEVSNVNPGIILLSLVFIHYNKKLKIKMKKNVIIESFDKNLDDFKTIQVQDDLPAYQILPIAYEYEIFDENNYIHLFDNRKNLIKREEIIDMYEYKWLYHASFSPVWFYRIQKYNGIISHSKKTVVFPDEESLQDFYLFYGYEPDELPRAIQNKSIGYFSNCEEMYEGKTWKTFYEKYGKNGLYVVN
jgi:hypothetical protein|uniref:Uncharacterized protein n=1 Tax=viral metagenome TaxID=1070528 RepID=A0A6C0DE54_9ZZZZ